MLRLGGPEPHGRRSGVVHVLTESEEEAPGARPDRRHAPWAARGAWSWTTSRTATSAPSCPRTASGPTTCTPSSSRCCSTRAAPRSCTPAGLPTSSPRWVASAVAPSASSPTTRCASAVPRLAVREKASRFVRLCDAFGVPLGSSWTCRATSPGVGQEWDGVVRRGAKLLHAFGECVVPRVTLVTRKTYGGAYIAMNAPLARRDPRLRVARRRGRRHGRRGRGADPAPTPARRRRARHPTAGEAELAAEHERIAGGVDRAIEIGVVDEGRGAGRHPRRHRARRSPTRCAATGCAADATATSRSRRRRTGHDDGPLRHGGGARSTCVPRAARQTTGAASGRGAPSPARRRSPARRPTASRAAVQLVGQGGLAQRRPSSRRRGAGPRGSSGRRAGPSTPWKTPSDGV